MASKFMLPRARGRAASSKALLAFRSARDLSLSSKCPFVAEVAAVLPVSIDGNVKRPHRPRSHTGATSLGGASVLLAPLTSGPLKHGAPASASSAAVPSFLLPSFLPSILPSPYPLAEIFHAPSRTSRSGLGAHRQIKPKSDKSQRGIFFSLSFARQSPRRHPTIGARLMAVGPPATSPPPSHEQETLLYALFVRQIISVQQI